MFILLLFFYFSTASHRFPIIHSMQLLSYPHVYGIRICSHSAVSYSPGAAKHVSVFILTPNVRRLEPLGPWRSKNA
jgi:hypothetical protein